MVDLHEEVESDMLDIPVPEHIWLELHREKDACDVIVRMEDGVVYTAMFATIPYLQRQMELSYQVTNQFPDTPAVRYTVIDTPHILVETLDQANIEDTIDNLIALEVFESYFTRVTAASSLGGRTSNDGKLATTEVAAVVISDVLVISNES